MKKKKKTPKRENCCKMTKLNRKILFSFCHATFGWLRKTYQNKNIKSIRFTISCIGKKYGYVKAMSLLLDWNYNILVKLAKMPVGLSMFGKFVG